MKVGITCFILGLIYILVSCTQDKVPPREKCTEEVTYDEIKFLIDRKCASSGCHDGSSGYGDYRTYADMKTEIANGSIESEVILKGTMPQEDTLSEMEFRLFQCWIDNGYIEE